MIDISRISRKRLLGKVLRWPLDLIPRNTVLPVLQGNLRGKKWIVGAGNHGHWIGSYELDKRRVFESTVKNGSVVLDLGAHAGFYTLLASFLVGEKGRVFAFEPDRKNLFYLKRHLQLNGVTNVTLIEAAVSDVDGKIFFTEGQNNTFTGRISESGDVTVPAVSLDELFAEGKLPLPDYIKIDIEGAEMRALSGAKNVLEAGRPAIFLSTHGSDLQEACCNFLRALGYRLQPLDGESLAQSEEILARWEDRSRES